MRVAHPRPPPSESVDFAAAVLDIVSASPEAVCLTEEAVKKAGWAHKPGTAAQARALTARL